MANVSASQEVEVGGGYQSSSKRYLWQPNFREGVNNWEPISGHSIFPKINEDNL